MQPPLLTDLASTPVSRLKRFDRGQQSDGIVLELGDEGNWPLAQSVYD
jgi:hypothetical protein